MKLDAHTKADFIPVDYPEPRRLRASFKKLMQAVAPSAVVAGSSGESEKKMDAVSAMKMLASLEGVLSPATYKKTKEGLRTVIHKGGT